jgi:hypothetical protein
MCGRELTRDRGTPAERRVPVALPLQPLSDRAMIMMRTFAAGRPAAHLALAGLETLAEGTA